MKICIDCNNPKKSLSGTRCKPCSSKLTYKNLGRYSGKGAIPWNKDTHGLMNIWNKGKKYPAPWLEEHRFQKGYLSPKKGKPQLEIKGERNGNWKGGNSGSERHRAMGGIEYKLWRADVFERDNYTCQKCNAKGIYLHADHIKEWAKYPELRYDVSNGQTLCNSCHYLKTFGREMPISVKWGIFKNV